MPVLQCHCSVLTTARDEYDIFLIWDYKNRDVKKERGD